MLRTRSLPFPAFDGVVWYGVLARLSMRVDCPASCMNPMKRCQSGARSISCHVFLPCRVLVVGAESPFGGRIADCLPRPTSAALGAAIAIANDAPRVLVIVATEATATAITAVIVVIAANGP